MLESTILVPLKMFIFVFRTYEEPVIGYERCWRGSGRGPDRSHGYALWDEFRGSPSRLDGTPSFGIVLVSPSPCGDRQSKTRLPTERHISEEVHGHTNMAKYAAERGENHMPAHVQIVVKETPT